MNELAITWIKTPVEDILGIIYDDFTCGVYCENRVPDSCGTYCVNFKE